MSKSFGKLVLFRNEDLLDSDTNIHNAWDYVEKRPWYNWSNEEVTKEIIRTQTFKYWIAPSASAPDLETFNYFPSLESISTPISSQPDTIQFNYKDWNGINYLGYINFRPHSWINPKGIKASEHSFINHNLAVPRPLITTKNGNEETNPASYGLDDQITVTPVYNFYLKEYENFFSADELPFYPPNAAGNLADEKAIPNFYEALFILSYFQQGGKQPDFGGKWKDLPALLKTTAWMLKHANAEFDASGYIDYFMHETDPETERNSVVVLTPDFYKTHNSFIETQKNVYPFYNKITIPVVKEGTALRDFFKWANVYDDLIFTMATSLKAMRRIQRGGTKGANDAVDALKKKYDIYKLSAESGATKVYIDAKKDPDDPLFDPDAEPEKVYSHTNKLLLSKWTKISNTEIYEFPFLLDTLSYGAFPLLAWPPSYDALGLVEQDSFNIPYINIRDKFDLYPPSPDIKWKDVVKPLNKDVPFEASGMLPLLLHGDEVGNDKYIKDGMKDPITSTFKKLINVIKLNARKVLENKENYSEVLYYEIAKYDSEPTSESIPLQTFIVPNDADLETVEYIDSQIKYGKKYYYQIYAHTMSIGNKMMRAEAVAPGLKTGKTSWQYDNDYDVRILRVPYYNISYLDGDTKPTTIADAPPMPPNINFFPYKNVSNKIGFWFNVQMGEAMMKPILFAASGPLDKMNQYIISQGYEKGIWNLNANILYKTDDYGGKFEVFRLTERPKTYADFAYAKIATVDVIGAKTFIDNIQPNQDYYYTFRSFDVHGMPSNPTPVYHFKMITHNDVPEADSVHIGTSGGQPVLFNKIIHLNDNYEKKKDNKSFKKYLLIEPSLRQTFLNFEKSGLGMTPATKNAAAILSNNGFMLNFGNSDEKLFGKKFKLRLTSKQTGRKLDVNVDFKSPNIYEKEEED